MQQESRGAMAALPYVRSWLDVAAESPEEIADALRRGADAVVVDLVGAAYPEDTRQALRQVDLRPHGDERPLLFARVHAPSSGLVRDDLAAAGRDGLDGVCVPDVASPEAVWQLQAWLVEAEQRAGRPPNTLPLLCTIGSAAGVWRAGDVAKASPRVLALLFDAAAFVADVGAEHGAGDEATLYARTQLVLASRMAGLRPPVDSRPPGRPDPEELERSTSRARALGFFGRLVADPRHVDAVNKVYTPTPAQLSHARAAAEGADPVLARRAAGLLAIAARLGAAEGRG